MKIALLLSLVVLLSCKQPPPAVSEGEVASTWQTDDSNYFSVRFPPSMTASTFNMGGDSKIFPGLGLEPKSNSQPGGVGSLFVAHDSTRAGMLLRDGLALRVKDLSEGGGILVVPAHSIVTKNGTCVGIVMTDPAEKCATGNCFSITYVAHCETPFSKRFTVMGLLPKQASPAKLDPAAVEMAKTFDRIMATLEFKKF